MFTNEEFTPILRGIFEWRSFNHNQLILPLESYMAIVRCGYCKFIREVPNQHAGKRAKCPSCQTAIYVQDAVVLIKDLSEEILQLHETILQTKQNARSTCDKETQAKLVMRLLIYLLHRYLKIIAILFNGLAQNISR